MMNYEQSLDVVGAKSFTYAMVAGLYVSNISLKCNQVILAKDYRDAMDLCGLEHVEWLHENVEGVKFFKIQVQAQSVPLVADELLSE